MFKSVTRKDVSSLLMLTFNLFIVCASHNRHLKHGVSKEFVLGAQCKMYIALMMVRSWKLTKINGWTSQLAWLVCLLEEQSSKVTAENSYLENFQNHTA